MTFCLQLANEWCMKNCKGKNEDDECILYLENPDEFMKHVCRRYREMEKILSELGKLEG